MNIRVVLYILFITLLFKPGIVYAGPAFFEEFEAYLHEERLKPYVDVPLYKEDIVAFYKAREFKPVWFDADNEKLHDIEEIQEIIHEEAYLNGLKPEDYNFEYILTTKASGKFDDLFDREWMLTNTVMNYINDIRTGRVLPHQYDPMIFTLPQHRALEERMTKLIETRNPKAYLQSLAPPQPEYAWLRDKLADYRKIASSGGWPKVQIASDTVIYQGDTHEAIPQIRARLDKGYHNYDGKLPKEIWIDKAQFATENLDDGEAHGKSLAESDGDGIAVKNPEMVYDMELAHRIVEFQYFHGKKADGVIGPQTIAALNTPVEDRINKIKLAMERWRWLPDDLGRKHVRVNIAAFYARAVENGKDQFVMPIIVGQVAHQTPVFSSVIRNVKIHPDWTSPDSIATRYVIPKIQKNPAVIHRLGYQVQDKQTGEFIPWDQVDIENLHNISLEKYQFRQKPGVNNALGLARFSIDNDYAIFMHGTPSVELFNKENRTYSSGCIRLENPLVMAHFLLHDQGMSKRELEDLYYLDEGEFPETTYIDLKEDVPVHLLYMTAWVDQKGYIHFADDVYGRDKKLKDAFEYTK